MAYFGVTTDGARLAAAADPSADLRERLSLAVAGVPRDAPIVVLVHGYKFNALETARDPHATLFSHTPAAAHWKIRSWPEGLGFASDTGETGLCVGLAWPASAPHLPNLLRHGRTGFAQVYRRAELIGRRLADLIALLQSLAPGQPIDVLAHSLGARIALTALPHLATAPGRLILLGAAEFDARALCALRAAPARCPPQIYNVTARANDVYDALFETFAPRQSWRERAIGLGLDAQLPNWLDMQIDRHDVTAWINSRGIALTPPNARLCHWSFYTRGGAFAVYEAILRQRAEWSIARLRDVACFAIQEPRWSRLLPQLRRGRPRRGAGPELGPELKSA